MAFTLGPTPVKVLQLGRWMLPKNHRTHILKLVNSDTKEDVPGAAATLSFNSCRPERFCFVTLPEPITLPPNTRYYLLAEEKAIDPQDDSFYAHDAVVTASAIAAQRRPVFLAEKGWTEMDQQGGSYGPLTFVFSQATAEDSRY